MHICASLPQAPLISDFNSILDLEYARRRRGDALCLLPLCRRAHRTAENNRSVRRHFYCYVIGIDLGGTLKRLLNLVLDINGWDRQPDDEFVADPPHPPRAPGQLLCQRLLILRLNLASQRNSSIRHAHQDLLAYRRHLTLDARKHLACNFGVRLPLKQRQSYFDVVGNAEYTRDPSRICLRPGLLTEGAHIAGEGHHAVSHRHGDVTRADFRVLIQRLLDFLSDLMVGSHELTSSRVG